LAGVFICNSTFVTAAILPGENRGQRGKPTLCYIYFGLRRWIRDVNHGARVLEFDRVARHTWSHARNPAMENGSVTLTAFRIVQACTSLTALSVVQAQPVATPRYALARDTRERVAADAVA
jgi:hypothetical protein